VSASTKTCSRLGVVAPLTPVTTVSQARTGVLLQARTTRRGWPASDTVESCAFAVAAAVVALTFAVVPTVRVDFWATAVPRTAPLASVVTTTSPPTTGRP
jgi:hypothetical protein